MIEPSPAGAVSPESRDTPCRPTAVVPPERGQPEPSQSGSERAHAHSAFATSAGLSWLTLAHAYPTPGTYAHHVDRRTCVGIILHAEGRLESITDGRQTTHRLLPGMVGFVPADQSRHTVLVSTDGPTAAFLVLIPLESLENLAAAEAIAVDPPETMAFVDPVVQGLMTRLRSLSAAGQADASTAGIVRRLLLRIAERLTGQRPRWRDDGRPFDAATLARITALVDDHLAAPPQLELVAARVGLSPSHCGRKFRLSTGMSFGRFCGLRRTQAALDLLRSADGSLATLAFDLGFSSQSHFTRTVSGLTGMTPARYRRGFLGLRSKR